MDTIRLLIIHHSATMRIQLKKIFNKVDRVEVIASTYAVKVASRKMQTAWPDVIILGVDKNRSDTYSFISQVNEYRFTPFVVITNSTEPEMEQKIKKATDSTCEVIIRPSFDITSFLRESEKLFIDAVWNVYEKNKKMDKKIKVHKTFSYTPQKPSIVLTQQPKLSPDVILPPWDGKKISVKTDRIVAIGASAGGINAIEAILIQLVKKSPGVVIVQHLPERFTADFAARIDKKAKVNVREAAHGDIVEEGVVLIAPGGKHMIIERDNTTYIVKIVDGPPVTRHKPSVDVLYRSLARCGGKNVLGIILTGMGDDGAREMVALQRSGAYTIAQDKRTSVVFGMPNEAIKRGGVTKVMPLQEIAYAIQQFYQETLR